MKLPSEGAIRHVVEVDLRTQDEGRIRLLRPIPRDGDPWGALAPLKGTAIGALIREVSAEALEEAGHGYGLPLAKELGRPPHACLTLIPKAIRTCSKSDPKLCGMANSKCTIDSGDPPKCLILPLPGAEEEASEVVRAWLDGRYVVVVIGEEV